MQPADHPEESTGPTYLCVGALVSTSPTPPTWESDSARSTPTHYAWFRTGPWLPWMKMGQALGYHLQR
ncbi:MAG: DUF1838 family protein [Rhodocyclaceae bacterium]|nr:DUF1838 family protein [Rhodocyclaceae bacterium]